MLSSFLSSQPELQKKVNEFYKHKQNTVSPVEEAKTLKHNLTEEARKTTATSEDKAKANQAVRNYDYILKLQKVRNKKY